MVNVSTPLMVYKNQLAREPISLRQMASQIAELKSRQIEQSLYTHARWCLGGSDTLANVISPDGSEKECIVWCVNHYTGLNRNPEVIRSVQEAVAEYGSGAGTSALSGGFCALHKQLEVELANFVGKEHVMLFPTGYTANFGAISALPQEDSLILFDRESHASLIDGIKHSRAKWLPFKHNSIEDLQKKLAKHAGRFRDVFVVVESAYSMSGDYAPLRQIVDLKKTHQFLLYVDEAHTFGFHGKNGAGYCSELGVTAEVDFLMSTLSKATASIGGFVACDSVYSGLLEWTANSYAFQASLTPPDAAAILASLQILRRSDEIQSSIHSNNAYLRIRLQQAGFDLGQSASPVVPIFIPNLGHLHAANRYLFDQGVFSVSIFYPVVKPDEGRIRLIVTARHTREQIDYTVDQLIAARSRFEGKMFTPATPDPSDCDSEGFKSAANSAMCMRNRDCL